MRAELVGDRAWLDIGEKKGGAIAGPQISVVSSQTTHPISALLTIL